MAKNAYFGTDTGNFGTGTAMYDDSIAHGQTDLPGSDFLQACPSQLTIDW